MRSGRRPSRRNAIAQVILALAAAAAAATAVHGQDVPQVISPLRVETDHNSVNLVSGRMTFDLPVLSVPAAPNLRYDRIQNAAPYVKGTVEGSVGEYSTASYSVHSGAAASESFHCVDIQDCSSVTGTGSTFRPAGTASFRYRQAGSGAIYIFDRMHTNSLGPPRRIQYYASRVEYPNGEIISYFYQTAVGGAFNQVFYRPTAITSNLGYYITLSYVSDDFNSMYWSSVSVATLYGSAAPATPLGRLTYGATITDLGGREFTCLDCHGIEVTAGSMQLPGEGSPALQVTKLPTAQLVQSVVRDGVPWTYSYSYQNGQPYFHAPTNGYWYTRLKVTGPNGFNQVYNFAISGQRNVLTGVTDSINRITGYQFDPAYRPTRIVSPEGNEVSVAYDLAGNVVLRRTTARPSTPVTPSVIDERAFYPIADLPNLCTVLCYRPLWSRDGLNRQTDYLHNDRGQLVEQTDPADANGVRRKTYISYETGTLSRRSVVRVCGFGTTCGTSAEIRTEYQYWANTFLPSLERRIDAATGQQLDTTYSYDLAGRLVSTDGPLPGSDDATYSRYDVHGRRTWEIGARAPNGLWIATRFGYRDSDDKPLSIEIGTLPDETSTTLTVLRRTDLGYDGRRNAIREAVSAGGTTYGVADKAYDDRGRLECTAVRMNPAAFASLPSDACAPGPQGVGANNFGPDRIARTLYDAAGQRLQLREGVGTPDEGTEATWGYNLNGQVTTVIDGNGNRAELRYDGHGRQDRWTFPSATPPAERPVPFDDANPASALATAGAVNAGDYEGYGYDAIGNRTSVRKRDGSLLAYQYDALNRMIVKTVPERANLTAAQTRDVFYSYDLRGLQLSARFDSQAGEGITNAYDGFGRLTSSSTDMGGVMRTLTYLHDANGNRTRITHPDGQWFATDYDGLNRPYWLYGTGGGVAQSYYTPAGALADLNRVGSTFTHIGYDAVQRPTWRGHFFTGADNVHFSYSAAWSYAFNPAGQIGSVSRDNDDFAWTGHYSVNRAYATNGLNQYTAAGPANFAYDANGNLTSDGIDNYGYDIENRMVAGPNGATLSYDPLGRLFQVIGPAPLATVTRFLYDGDALIAEYDGSNNMIRRHVHWVGQPAPAEAGVPMATYEGAGFANLRQLFADHQGSIVALADTGGHIVTINTYDEYGIPGAGNVGRFQYTGQIWLPQIGMYYYKARAYSPTLGRFMQTDPIGYDDQFNLYAYVGNDPINRTDPDGMQTTEIQGGGGPLQQVADYVAWVASDTANLVQGIAQGRLEWALSRMPATPGTSLSPAPRAIAGLTGTFGRAASAENAALRARQIHSELDAVAQSRRTTTVLQTNRGTVVADGGRDVIPAQIRALRPGETAARAPGVHAEVTAMRQAQGSGARMQAMGTSRPMCPACQAAVRATGGRVISPTTAVWPRAWWQVF